jgi:hypothetical protein
MDANNFNQGAQMDGGVLGFFIVWIFLSAGIGMLASSRGRSWFGFFLLALITSPLVGLIVVLVMRDEKAASEEAWLRQRAEEVRMEELKTMASAVTKTNLNGPVVVAPATASVHGRSIADELSKLATLRDQGVLTDAEFQAQKALLLKPAT